MLTTRQTTVLRLLAAVVVVGVGLTFAGVVRAQQHWAAQPATLVWHPASVHYDQVRTTYWHWTPELGWHSHDQYVYVPHWVPGHWAPTASTYTVVEYR